MRKIIDLTGCRFGKLTVLMPSGVDSSGHYTWLCECDCGNMKTINGDSLRRGLTTSCGCITYKHGDTDSKLYRRWQTMRRRCYDSNKREYGQYGGRGIQVCDRWCDFSLFKDDVTSLPHAEEPGYTLDRIDNDGNYEPENIRWATRTTQANNRRSNVTITYNGESHTLSEWSRKLGINYYKLRQRLKLGWSIERAFAEK